MKLAFSVKFGRQIVNEVSKRFNIKGVVQMEENDSSLFLKIIRGRIQCAKSTEVIFQHVVHIVGTVLKMVKRQL
jgi:hypothetical protein